MDDYPGNVREFESRFLSEEACRAYLMQLRWAEGVVCTRCGRCEVWDTSFGLLVCASCDMVGNQPESRDERTESASDSRLGDLSHGADLASQAQADYGQTGAKLVIPRMPY